ncbi:MAG TPA: hypothetical protein DEB40_00070 [Elusimicrobia bacterium]|nr:hypothetical protein [Elusimicrobiota bacterium]HBT60128.1 hypothetical protein [Elusimicrobiota bacterium]
MILLHARSGRTAGAAGTWAFLGRDSLSLFSWQDKLGSGWNRLDLSRELAQTADSLRRPYTEWVESLSAAHGADPAWWTTEFAERNSFSSPFFLHLCQLVLLRRLASEKRLPDLAVCESWGQLRSLAAMLGQTPGPGLQPLMDMAKLIIRMAQILLSSAVAFHAARSTRQTPTAFPKTQKPRALISTFAHDSCLAEDGKFRDRYFRDLAKRLEEKGLEVWILPYICEISRPRTELLRWLRQSPSRLIIKEDWITWTDVAGALLGGARSLFLPRQTPPFQGLDIKPLAREMRLRQARSPEAFESRLLLRLLPRLKEAGFCPDLVLSWFENQRQDKALALAARQAFPKADHVGVLCALPNPNYMTMFPTLAEARCGALPGRVVCCGSHQAEVLDLFGSNVAISVGAALRYQYLWEDNAGAISSGPRTAFIPLPSRLGEAVELIESLRPVLSGQTGIERWWIRPHPDYGMADLRSALGKRPWPAQLEVSPHPLQESLRQSSVVLSAGSGALAEAACMGLPVMAVGRLADLDFDPMAYFPDICRVCRGPEEISQELRRILNLSDSERQLLKEKGAQLRGRCFARENEQTLASYWTESRQREVPCGR